MYVGGKQVYKKAVMIQQTNDIYLLKPNVPGSHHAKSSHGHLVLWAEWANIKNSQQRRNIETMDAKFLLSSPVLDTKATDWSRGTMQAAYTYSTPQDAH